MTKVFSEKEISLSKVMSATSKQGIATTTLGFVVKSRRELNEIINRLQAIRGIQAIRRT